MVHILVDSLNLRSQLRWYPQHPACPRRESPSLRMCFLFSSRYCFLAVCIWVVWGYILFLSLQLDSRSTAQEGFVCSPGNVGYHQSCWLWLQFLLDSAWAPLSPRSLPPHIFWPWHWSQETSWACFDGSFHCKAVSDNFLIQEGKTFFLYLLLFPRCFALTLF